MMLAEMIREVEQLENSPLVALSRGEIALKEAMAQRLAELRGLERRGLEIMKSGYEESLLRTMMGEDY